MRFFIKTYGCQMNEADSERIARLLVDEGYSPAQSEGEADLIVLNTCAVRESAEKKVWGKLGRLAQIKRRKPNLIIAVGGCMGQAYGKRIIERFPYVDLVFGTRSFVELPRLIRLRLKKGKPVIDISEPPKSPFTPQMRLNGVKAWVPISTGCDNFCSYCIVPYVRGRLTNRPVDEIVSDVEKLAEEGYKEITLLGQNVNSYKWGEVDFPKLLSILNGIDGIKRIRFVTSHPKDVPEELLDAVAELEKVCEHLHLPAQSGSNSVLKRMNRQYTRERYLRIVEGLKERVPWAAITTDLLVGFPGETEEEFEETMRLVEEVRFDYAFCYKFSPRPGTPAAEMGDQVPEETKCERLKKLIDLTQRIALERNEEMIGRVEEVLAEGENPKAEGELKGRTRTNKLVFFRGDRRMIGSILKVRIREASYWYLRGEVEDELRGAGCS